MTGRAIREVPQGADRAAAIEVTRLAFAPQEDPLRFLARRLASVRRHVATPWLVEAEGRPVSSLLAFPLSLRTPDGENLAGVGLGAVATDPEARRRGHAQALCRRVVEVAQERGAPLGLLFSAIDPGLYERVGFRIAPAWNPVFEDLPALATAAPPLHWQPIDPRHQVSELGRIWDRAHTGTLHLRRDAEAWRRSFEYGASDLWLGWESPLRGYARVSIDAEKLFLSELFFEDSDPQLQLRGLAGLASVGARWDCHKLLSWLRPTEATAPWLSDQGRAQTLPMLRSTADPADLWVWPSDYF